MKQFAISLKTDAPLAIRSDHAATGAATAKYISGTTLIGSLATVYRLLHPHDTGEFDALFLSEQVSYPNLYPAVFPDEDMSLEPLPVYPFPKTAQSCKRFKGFLYQFPGEIRRHTEDHHGVRDTLFDWAIFASGGNSGALNKAKDCPFEIGRDGNGEPIFCGAAMDHINGYYRREQYAPHNMIAAEIDSHLRLQTRTGINRETGTVEEGILYSRQVFEEDMRFWGEVKVPDDGPAADLFAQFIEQVGHMGLVRIGTGRTRGLGKVTLDAQPIEEEQDAFSVFEERLERFNSALRHQAQAYGINTLPSFFFTLTLHSPAILCNPQLRYRGSINPQALQELTSLPAAMFKLNYQAASVQRVMGWNQLWGTPRANEYAIDTGSVFLFSCEAEPDDAVLQALFALEQQSIGRRRAEGFGRVCISDPFHLEVNPR